MSFFDPTIPYQIEHDFAQIIEDQMLVGVGFDVDAAQQLDQRLEARRVELRDTLASTFSPVVHEWLTPKKRLPRRKETPVNPNSRQQVAAALIRDYDWEPLEYGNDGHPKLDEDTLDTISPKKVPIIEDIKEQFVLSKILGQLSNGDRALLRHVVQKPHGARVYGYTNHNGTRTHRCTHGVVANIPRPTSRWGSELRSLFVPRRGWKMVGADMSGIEARGMAHYLWPLDGGQLAARVPTGDIHSDVWEATKPFGVDSRNDSKTNFYATTYGASARTIAAKNNVSVEHGQRIKDVILEEAVPGLGQLIQDVTESYVGVAEWVHVRGKGPTRRIVTPGRGFLFGLDGRRIYPAKETSSFNALIQCFGAVVMKKATKLLHDRMAEQGEPCGTSWFQVIHYHDEYEAEAHPDVAEQLLEAMIWAIVEAGERLGVKCPLAGEGKVGDNWAEVH